MAADIARRDPFYLSGELLMENTHANFIEGTGKNTMPRITAPSFKKLTS